MTMKPQTNVLSILAISAAFASNAFVTAREPLSIRVSPIVSLAPATLLIRTSIEPDASNRAVELVADSEGFYRSSLVQLDGERAPKTTIFELRSLPPGEYEVKASLMGPGGRARAVVREHINVLGTSR
jgi:hypothetical protein